MSRKKIFATVVVLVGFLIASTLSSGWICPRGSAQAAEAKSWKGTRVTIGTASMGGIWYLMGGAYADRLSRSIKDLQASNTTGNAGSNMKAVDGGKMEVAINYTNQAYAAFQGNPPFEKPLKNLRFLGAISDGIVQTVVPKNSPVKTIGDLKDKRINTLVVGGATRFLVASLLKVYGITFESIEKNGGKVYAVGHQDGATMMRNGQLDALWFWGGQGPNVVELSTNPGVRLISIADRDLERVLAAPGIEGMTQAVVPKSWYSLDQDVQTISAMQVFVIRADLPEDLVYEMARALYEKNEDLKAVWGIQKDQALDLKRATVGAILPIHPGAKRYYKEKGIPFKD